MKPAFLLCSLLLLSPALRAEPLAALFEKAWQRAPQAALAGARQETVRAGQEAAGALFPEAPSIGLLHTSDRAIENQGRREEELELSLPLWQWGQKSAARQAAQALAGEQEAAIGADRLALAGELRRSLAALREARAAAELAREQARIATELEADVARRVKVGDLARSDLLLARQEALTSQGEAARLEAELAQARQQWRLLTGGDALPDPLEEQPAEVAPGNGPQAYPQSYPDAHPEFQAGARRLALSQAEFELARASRRGAPSLELSYTRGRDDFAAPRDAAVKVGIRIPLDSAAVSQPRLAAANQARIQAEAEQLRRQAELPGRIDSARARLAAADTAARLAREGATLAEERRTLLQRAFQLGELGFADYQRVLAQTHAARLGAALADIRRASAIADLNQALGKLP